MNKLLNNKFWWILLIAFFAAIIWLSGMLHTSMDLTQEKRYSLTPATQKMLQELDTTVVVDVYLSGKLSPTFKKLGNSTEELLEQMKSKAGSKLRYRFVSVCDGLNDTTQAMLIDSFQRMGFPLEMKSVAIDESLPLCDQFVFPMAMVHYGAKYIPVDLRSTKQGLDEESQANRSEALLEFKFADAIDKMSRKRSALVGYAFGHGEPWGYPNQIAVSDLLYTVSRNYKLDSLNVREAKAIDVDHYQALLIVKPTQPFSEADKMKLDQYVMHGGKIIWLIDNLQGTEIDSLMRKKADFVAFERGLNIEDLLFKYGARINRDLVQDLKCAKQPLIVGQKSDGQPDIQRVPWVYYPLLSSANTHPISKNLDDIISFFPSSIDTIQAPGIRKTILLSTDTTSRSLASPAMVSLQSVKSEDDVKTFNKSYLPIAVLLEGKFQSPYSNRIPQSTKDSLAAAMNKPWLGQAANDGKMIVCADADLATNQYTQTEGPLQMGMQRLENYRFANKEFVQNCLDYLLNDRQILEARSKDITLRLLDKQKVSEQKTKWQFLNIGLPILLMLLFGAFYRWRRKQKYQA
jgi:ABC-2 type transport system permease protein